MARSDKSGRKKQKLPQRQCATQYKWRTRFLGHLKRYAAIGYAAELAGISERTVYRHRKKDPSFLAACEKAVETAVDGIEGRAFRDARDPRLTGNHILKMFLLKTRRRGIYGDQPAQIIDLEKLVELLAQVPATIERGLPQRPRAPAKAAAHRKVKTTGGNGWNGGAKKSIDT